jgi:hypothetical protein
MNEKMSNVVSNSMDFMSSHILTRFTMACTPSTISFGACNEDGIFSKKCKTPILFSQNKNIMLSNDFKSS